MADFRTAAIQRIVEYNSMAAAATTTTTGGISIAEYTAIVTRNGSGRYNNNIIISHGTPVPTATNYYSPSRINNKNNNQPLSFQPSSCHKKVLFTHKALSCYSDDDDEDDATQDTSLFDSSTSGGGGAHVATRSRLASAAPVWNGSVLRSMNYGCVNSVDMIQTILIVDSSLVCLSLFAKGLHWMLPHATITLARTQDEALKYFAGVNFDVVIVEERLKPIARSQHSHHRHHQSHHHYHRNRHDHSGTNSGSGLLREMMQQRKKECRYRHSNNCLQNQEILYIGVSAHFDADATKLREHGADVVWPKPPPLMDCHLRDDILQVLHRKRGTKR